MVIYGHHGNMLSCIHHEPIISSKKPSWGLPWVSMSVCSFSLITMVKAAAVLLALPALCSAFVPPTVAPRQSKVGGETPLPRRLAPDVPNPSLSVIHNDLSTCICWNRLTMHHMVSIHIGQPPFLQCLGPSQSSDVWPC